MNKQQIISLYNKVIIALNLTEVHAIVGMGSAMVLQGIREETNDLNIALTQQAFNDLANTNQYPCHFCNDIPVLTYLPNVKIHAQIKAINYVKFIGDIPCDTLDNILFFKQQLNRPKDQVDIELLQSAIKTKSIED